MLTLNNRQQGGPFNSTTSHYTCSTNSILVVAVPEQSNTV